MTIEIAEEGRAADAVVAPLGVIPSQWSIAEADPEVEAVAAAWIAFKAGACPRSRERLILHYAPLVTAVASRVGMRLPAMVEVGDLVSYGMFGLIDAIEKFELDRDVKFETYASARIRGAILDELRAMDWIPRSVRTKARSLERVRAELEAELHRAPSDLELASALELTVAEVRAICGQMSTLAVAALDEIVGSADDRDGVCLGDMLGDSRAEDPAMTVEDQEVRFLLARAIERLGDRERMVLVLYYYEGMTLAEIGRTLGVTESRISQMHTAAMGRLRTRLLSCEGI